jgi:hypothetical protein
VAWVSLDPFDDDPGTLLASLASAYCRAGLGSDNLVRDMRGQGVSVLGRAAPRLAAEFRASPEPFVLMMDDVHEFLSRRRGAEGHGDGAPRRLAARAAVPALPANTQVRAMRTSPAVTMMEAMDPPGRQAVTPGGNADREG